MPAPCVFAIDPGRDKCGVAAVDSEGAVLHRTIVPTAQLPALIASLAAKLEPQAVIVGDGTGSAPICRALEAAALPAPLERVDERHTSELARARQRAQAPSRGWRRLIPRALRPSDAPYDDYVAIILAERWWATRGS